MDFIHGKCLCGEITVSIPEEVFNTASNVLLCHCRNCQQTSGSTGALVIIVSAAALNVNGEPKTYEDNNTDSGSMLKRSFCGNCGSPIYGMKPTMSDIRFVRLGLFDNLPKPAMELYCKRSPAWNQAIEGAKQFEKMATS